MLKNALVGRVKRIKVKRDAKRDVAGKNHTEKLKFYDDKRNTGQSKMETNESLTCFKGRTLKRKRAFIKCPRAKKAFRPNEEIICNMIKFISSCYVLSYDVKCHWSRSSSCRKLVNSS